MIVTCSCGAKLKIGDDKLTDAGVRIKCPKCGTPHLVKRPAPSAPVPPAAPAMPWFASEPAGAARQQAPAASKPSPAAAPTAPPAMPWFASEPAGAPAEPKAPQQAASPSSPLVLVAHDSAVVVDMIRGVVGGAGLTVEHAPDGLDALKKASALKPQVMIVDVGLTGIYGFELCERLKSDPDTRGIKIILLSSVYGLTAYKRNPVNLYGADDYIEKHHIPDRLVSKIQDLLAGRKAAAPPPSAEVPQPAAEARPAPVTLSPGREPKAHQPAPAGPPAAVPERKPVVPDADDVLPKVPVTLDGTRRLTPPPMPVPAAKAAPAPAARPAPPPAAPMQPAEQDASIKLDAAFFEQDEYKAPEKTPARTALDPAEVEKARRFARLVVSDIVLYNQEAVAEGIAKGTFYELLRDDITEGRALYDKRVPESVRASMDYFQEAFDNFIASKKKQR